MAVAAARLILGLPSSLRQHDVVHEPLLHCPWGSSRHLATFRVVSFPPPALHVSREWLETLCNSNSSGLIQLGHYCTVSCRLPVITTRGTCAMIRMKQLLSSTKVRLCIQLPASTTTVSSCHQHEGICSCRPYLNSCC